MRTFRTVEELRQALAKFRDRSHFSYSARAASQGLCSVPWPGFLFAFARGANLPWPGAIENRVSDYAVLAANAHAVAFL